MDIERGKIVTAAVLIPEASAVSKVTDRASALPFDKKVTESTINLNGSGTDTSNAGGITIVDEKETHTKDSVETIILPFNTPAYWSICLFTIATVFGIVSMFMCAFAFNDELDFEYYSLRFRLLLNVFTALAGLLYTISIPLSFYSASAYRDDASVVNQNRLGSKCLMVASWVLYGFSTLLWTSSIITVIFSPFFILPIISIVFSIISWSFMFNHSEYTRKGSTINLNGSRTDTSNVGGITIVDEEETHTKDSVETIILPFNKPAYWSICLFTIATAFGIVSIFMCALAFYDESNHEYYSNDDDWYFGNGKYHEYDPVREISITYNVFTTLAGLLYTVSIPLSFYSTSAYRNDASVVNQNRLGSKCLMVASWVLYGFSTSLWTSSIITVIFSPFYILHIISIVFSIISWSFMFNHSEYTRKGWK